MDKDENKNFAEIDISFQGKKLNKLTVSKLTIWSSGNTVIRKADIAPAEPLRLSVENAEILNCRITQKTDSALLFVVSDETSAYSERFEFDYFAKNDGFSCELIHTGEEDKVKFQEKQSETEKRSAQEINTAKLTMKNIFVRVFLLRLLRSLFL